MKKIIYKTFVILIFLLMVMNLLKISENVSKAANYSFNFTGPTTASAGDTLTFTITGNGLTGNVKLSGNNVNLSDSQKWIEKNSVTFTAKITKFPATVTAIPVELTDNDYNIVSIPSKTITITEKKTEVPPTNNNNQDSKPDQSESNNQNSNQGQSGSNSQNSNQGQSSNVGQSSNQGNNNSSNSSSGKVNNQGNSSQSNLNEQGNIKSSNNYLKSLEVNIGTLDPEFYRENYEYIIDNIIEDEIQVVAEAEDEKAIVNGTGTIALVGGENRVNIEVIAENEQARTYTIIVNKLEEIIESDLRLSNLEIQTINEENKFENLDIGFDKNTLEYEVSVEDNVTDLSIQPTIDKEGVIVETKGDKNLKEGLNVVTITLSKQNNDNNMINIDDDLNNEINQDNDLNVNMINDNFNGNDNVKEQTTYVINVNRKAKPITEISSKGVENNKFVAGIIFVTLVVVLLIATFVAHKKRNKVNVKTKKYKRAK